MMKLGRSLGGAAGKQHKYGHRETYSAEPPCDQNAVDMFDGQWTSRLPGFERVGAFTGFDDGRIKWLLDRLDVRGYKVLELGPLEGAHTFMLEKAGADVTAIEGNHAAFLRCLVVKNLFDLRSKFVLGDFSRSLGPAARYDLIVASGVLYHMTDPVSLIRKLCSASARLFFWTHYFEPDFSKWSPDLRHQIDAKKWRTDLTEVVDCEGISVRLVPQYYAEALDQKAFCGGPDVSSKWIYRDDILELLRANGYSKIELAFDHPRHPNGPAFCILACREKMAT